MHQTNIFDRAGQDLRGKFGPLPKLDLRVLLMCGAFIRCSLHAEGLHAQVMHGVVLRDFVLVLCMELCVFLRLHWTAAPDHHGRLAACTFALYTRALSLRAVRPSRVCGRVAATILSLWLIDKG